MVSQMYTYEMFDSTEKEIILCIRFVEIYGDIIFSSSLKVPLYILFGFYFLCLYRWWFLCLHKAGAHWGCGSHNSLECSNNNVCCQNCPSSCNGKHNCRKAQWIHPTNSSLLGIPDQRGIICQKYVLVYSLFL